MMDDEVVDMFQLQDVQEGSWKNLVNQLCDLDVHHPKPGIR
jgi:hypothetical protein